MNAIIPSWSAQLTANLERQLMRVQALAVAWIKNQHGCSGAQKLAARTSVDALFNGSTEQMAAYIGYREDMKLHNILIDIGNLK